jgi:hypothetical protein
MVLALAVLLMQPLASPAAALPTLPIQATQISFAILSPAPVNAPDNPKDDKTANKDSKDAQSSMPSDAARQTPSSTHTVNTEAGFSSSASYAPGQFELTRVPSATDNDANSTVLSEYANGDGSPAPVVLAPLPRKPAEFEGRGTPKMWFVLGAAEHGAATFDAWSTRRNISEGYVETDPLLKPFANSGALYAVMQVAPFAFDFLGKEMLHSSHPWVRRMWWVPQTGSTVASVFAGAHNMSIH